MRISLTRTKLKGSINLKPAQPGKPSAHGQPINDDKSHPNASLPLAWVRPSLTRTHWCFSWVLSRRFHATLTLNSCSTDLHCHWSSSHSAPAFTQRSRSPLLPRWFHIVLIQLTFRSSAALTQHSSPTLTQYNYWYCFHDVPKPPKCQSHPGMSQGGKELHAKASRCLLR